MYKYIYKLTACVILSTAVLTSCYDDMLTVSDSSGTVVMTNPQDDSMFVPGTAIIELKQNPAGASTRAASNVVTRAKVFSNSKVKVRQLFDMTTKYASLKHRIGLDRWFVVEFDKNQNVNEVVNELQKDPAIASACGSLAIKQIETCYTPLTRATEGDYVKMHNVNDGQGLPNFTNPDKYLKHQWHYMTTASNLYNFKPGADINLFPAWGVETGDSNVIVAVLDSGIDFGHEDLAGAKWEGNPSGGRNFFNAMLGENQDEIIPGYHGTHVAGTIAARNNNGIGVSGIAGGNGTKESGVRLMSCEIYGRDGDSRTAGTEGIVRAFEFAAENGALICNCSWGYPFSRKDDINNEIFHKRLAPAFEALKKGIDYFTKYAGCDTSGNPKPNTYMKGGLVFFASGNDGQDDIEMIPASYDKVVAVGAFGSDYTPTDYMDKGPWVDILAPGGVVSKDIRITGVLSTVPKDFENAQIGKDSWGREYILPDNNNYAFAQGTSMATPHVTGIAALVVSKFGKQKNGGQFTNEELRKRILGAVKSVSPYKGQYSDPRFKGKLGIGYIDAFRALAEPETKKPIAPQLEVESYTDNHQKGYYDATVKWKVTADEDAFDKKAFVYDVTLYRKSDQTKAVQQTTVFSYEQKIDQYLQYEFTGLDSNIEYIVKVVARDRSDNKSEEVSKEFKTKLNQAPEFTTNIDNNIKLLDTDSHLHLQLPVKDAEGHKWEYKVTQLPLGVEFKRLENDVFDLLIQVKETGKFSFTITLIDELGGKTEKTINYEVMPHAAPTLKEDMANVALIAGSAPATIDLSSVFEIVANQKATFSAKSNDETVAVAEVNEVQQLIIKPLKPGIATIIVNVNDGFKQAVNTIQVRVTKKGSGDAFSIYPNPAHSYIKALMRPGIQQVEATVTSLRGQRLIHETLQVSNTNEVTLGVDRLAPGTYYLLIKTANATTKHTFIKK